MNEYLRMVEMGLRKSGLGLLNPMFSRVEHLVRPTGSGWQSIPGGKHGGYRRHKGVGWEYWYPEAGGSNAPHPGEHEAVHREHSAELKQQEAAPTEPVTVRYTTPAAPSKGLSIPPPPSEMAPKLTLKPKKHTLSDTQQSLMETDVLELAQDPEGHGLSGEEAEQYKILADAVSEDGKITLPPDEAKLSKLHDLLTHIANSYDDMIEQKMGDAESRKDWRAARAAATSLAVKVVKYSSDVRRSAKKTP